MKALVIGGTGPTGPYIVKGLIERGYRVSIFHSGAHETDLPDEVECGGWIFPKYSGSWVTGMSCRSDSRLRGNDAIKSGQ